eukprot:gene4968-3566_t
MPEVVHALKDKWFLSFLPLITKDLVLKQYNGDWNVAAQEKTRRLDYITTVEELWSTVNSLPHIHQLGVGSTYIFSRQDKQASYEAFPEGSRVTVKLMTTPATDRGVDVLLAAILGESMPDSAGGGDAAPICDVIRVCGRQNREFPKLIQVEVWLNDKKFSEAVVQALKQALKEQEIPEATYSIASSDFDTPQASPTTSNSALRSHIPLRSSRPLSCHLVDTTVDSVAEH